MEYRPGIDWGATAVGLVHYCWTRSIFRPTDSSIM
jgi:hypothetical protein